MADPSALLVAKPLPTRRLANRQIAFGAALVVIATACVVLDAAFAAAPFAILGAFLLYAGVLLRLSGDAVPLVNTAYNAAQEGRVADAERILDALEGRFQLAYLRRAIDAQRAQLALRRGDLDGAIARAGAVIARRVGFFTAAHDRAHIAGAHSLRALIFASRGEGERARADIAAARGAREATADSLARAAVAEAVLLERAGERDALAAHLAAERRLLFDHTPPRERAVVRAYRRMLKVPRTSVYRSAAPREEAPAAGDEPSVADWIAQIAPAAAPFARARVVGAAETLPAQAKAVAPDLLRAAKERLGGKGLQPAGPPARRVLLLWALLIVMFLAIWQFLSPSPATRVPVVDVDEPARVAAWTWQLAAGTMAMGALPVLLLVLLFVRNRRHGRGLTAAVSALARGDAGAEAQLEGFVRAPQALIIGQAHLHLARLAEQRADLEGALAHCDRGIAAVAGRDGTRALASIALLPDLLTERALVLAATDRDQEASAEMAAVAEAFPSYPYRAPAELRVALVQRARRGDLEGAARLAEGRSEDLPLPLRDETLADLVRAAAHPEQAGAGEIERLKEDLQVDAELRRWLEVVAPAALAAFSRSGEEAGHDAEAEREALAEQEAAALATARATA